MELSSFLTGAVSSRSIPANGDGHAAAAAQPTAAAEGGGAMLQSDPDLEAYLQARSSAVPDLPPQRCMSRGNDIRVVPVCFKPGAS